MICTEKIVCTEKMVCTGKWYAPEKTTASGQDHSCPKADIIQSDEKAVRQPLI